MVKMQKEKFFINRTIDLLLKRMSPYSLVNWDVFKKKKILRKCEIIMKLLFTFTPSNVYLEPLVTHAEAK